LIVHPWDDQFDVVIIGSGLAGLSAAVESVSAGAAVAVFEKMENHRWSARP
jgi:succinate dehydrogenase/fumarate reductase flavoprotein subunit